MAALYPSTTQFPSTTLFPQGPDGPVLLAHLGFEDPATDDGNRDWFNATDRLRGEAAITRGRASELDTVEPAVASALFENRDSELSPENTAGAHFGDLVPMRRLWLRSQWENETLDLFKGYVEGFDPDWPEAGFDNVCRVTAVDGSKVLNLWELEAPQRAPKPYTGVTGFRGKIPDIPLTDPYGIRILVDRPWAFWRLDEKAGTRKMTESSGRGNEGDYRGNPTRQQDPLITGGPGKAVAFSSGTADYGFVNRGFPDAQAVTVEFWMNATTLPTGANFVAIMEGPVSAASGNQIFDARINGPSVGGTAGPVLRMRLFTASGAGFAVYDGEDDPLEVDTTYHVVMTYDGTDMRIYIDGSEIVGTLVNAPSGDLPIDHDNNLYIAASAPGTGNPYNGRLDELAIYDKVLADDQIAQHFMIGRRGFLEHASGTRIGEALDQAGIFGVRTLHAGERNLLPVAFASGSALDVIQQAVYSEGIPAIFYFDRSGIPVFLDRGYRSDAPYTTTQVTFGQAASEVPYLHLDIATGDGFLYNEVRTGRDEEDAVPQVVEDATSKGRYLTRVYEKTGMICTTDANALTEANTLLAQLKDPFTRVIGVDVALTDLLGTISSRHAINRLLSLELGEKVVVKREDRYGATTLSQTSYVEADELRMAAGAAGWSMRLGVSPR